MVDFNHKEIKYPIGGAIVGIFAGLLFGLIGGWNVKNSSFAATLLGIGGATVGVKVSGRRTAEDEIGTHFDQLLLFSQSNENLVVERPGGIITEYWELWTLDGGPYKGYIFPKPEVQKYRSLLEGHTLHLGGGLKRSENEAESPPVTVTGKAQIRLTYFYSEPKKYVQKFPTGNSDILFEEIGALLQRHIEDNPFTSLQCGAIFKDKYEDIRLKIAESGLKLDGIFVKDFTLPQELLDLMMQEVKAEYEGRALGREALIVIGILKEIMRKQLGHKNLARAGFGARELTAIATMAPELLKIVQAASSQGGGYVMNEKNVLKDILEYITPKGVPPVAPAAESNRSRKKNRSKRRR